MNSWRLGGSNHLMGLSGIEHLQLVPLESEFAVGVIDWNLVFPAPTGRAILLLRVAHARKQAIQRKIGQTVHFQKLANLLDRAIVGDQFLAGWEINSIEAGMPYRRT
jgi:hypothetical protein